MKKKNGLITIISILAAVAGAVAAIFALTGKFSSKKKKSESSECDCDCDCDCSENTIEVPLDDDAEFEEEGVAALTEQEASLDGDFDDLEQDEELCQNSDQNGFTPTSEEIEEEDEETEKPQ